LIGDTNADIVHLEMGVYLFILFGVFFWGGWGSNFTLPVKLKESEKAIR